MPKPRAIARPLTAAAVAMACAAFIATTCAPAPAPRPETPAQAKFRGPEMAPGPGLPRPPKPVAAAPAPVPRPRVVAVARLAATGDVMMHGRVLKAAAEHADATNHGGHAFLYEAIRPALHGADVVFANLETPVAPKASKGMKEFVFNAPLDTVRGLQAVGFNLVALANNHAYDQDHAGVAETVANLEELQMPYIGAGRDYAAAQAGMVRAINGIRIGFLGITKLMNNWPEKQDPAKPAIFMTKDDAEMAGAVRALRAQSQFVVVSIHWGEEYKTAPRAGEITTAHALFEAGADVIFGHHPHVLQPIETYAASDGRLCAVYYSLGNFISNQTRFYAHGVNSLRSGYPRDGVIASVAIEKVDNGFGTVSTRIGELSYTPLWTVNNALEARSGRKAGQKTVIQPVINDLEIARLEQALAPLAAKGDALTVAEKAQAAAWQSERALYLERRDAAIAILGEDFYQPLLPTAP